MGPKTIIYDIELAPATVAVWQLKTSYIPPENVLTQPYILCAAWKELGKDKVHSVGVSKRNPKDDRKVVQALREMTFDADILVTHNGIDFDNKILNGRCLYHGMGPIDSQVQQVDTLKVLRRNVNILSNKLDYALKFIGHEGKTETSKGMFLKCLAGDWEAIKEAMAYNIDDVLATEYLYQQIRGFVNNHPNVGLYMDDENLRCRNCGSTNVIKHGKRAAPHGAGKRMFHRYMCKDCGKTMKGPKPIDEPKELLI